MTPMDNDRALAPIDTQLDSLFAAAAEQVAPDPALAGRVLDRVRAYERARTRVMGLAVGVGLSLMALSVVVFSGRWSALMTTLAQSRPGPRLLSWLAESGAVALDPTMLVTLMTPLAVLILWPLLSGSRTA
ncbi:MAG: hypothetical protein AAGI15_03910 [Pseudomonadota bacterium]